VRESDGLAMSSRNRYLSPEDRAAAAVLPRAMKAAIEAIEEGAAIVATLEKFEVELIDAGFASIDYATLADATDLTPLTELRHSPMRLLVAARIGGTRLIDNMAVEGDA
jgi:pantoate--beta-alanine ligase